MGRKAFKQEFKVIHIFKDGRRIAAEDFDPKRDLTEDQFQALAQGFAEVIYGANYSIIDVEKDGENRCYEVKQWNNTSMAIDIV